MSELKLLNCPFCGGEAEVGYTNQHDKLFVVGCNTQMCFGNINHFTMVFVDKESAIKTWNTRKPLDNIVEKLEEEKQRLKGLKNNCIALSDSEVIAIEEKAYNFAINIVKQDINNGLE